MRLLLLLPLLGGCPYIFGGPDLSNVGAEPVDTDTDVVPDTDVPPDTDADTDTDTTIPGDTPLVVSAEVQFVWIDHLVIRFSVADGDDDLVGGTLRLRDGTNELQSWDVPIDIPVWDPAGLSTVEHYVTIPCTGYHPDLNLVLEDLAGHASAPMPVPLDVVAVAAPSGLETYSGIVVPSVPATFCSTGDLANPDRQNPPIEGDYFWFDNPAAADLFVTLDWDPALLADIDLLLDATEGYPLPDPYLVAFSQTIGYDGHEQLRAKNMDTVGAYYGLLIETWETSPMAPNPGGPWPYQVIIQEAP